MVQMHVYGYDERVERVGINVGGCRKMGRSVIDYQLYFFYWFC